MIKTAVVVLGLTSGGVYAFHMAELPLMVGLASAFSMMIAVVPVRSTAASIVVAVTIFFLAVMMVLATNGLPDARAVRIVRDVGWTDAALGAWLAYLAASASAAERRASRAFDDAARARWRSGDVRFAAELARRVAVGAEPHWVALVVETAWPLPRPPLAEELLSVATEATATEIAGLRERMETKGGVGPSEARWDLLRAGCEVLAEARGSAPEEHFGGPAASRFVLAAAKVVRDDEDASRIFAALVLPAIGARPHRG